MKLDEIAEKMRKQVTANSSKARNLLSLFEETANDKEGEKAVEIIKEVLNLVIQIHGEIGVIACLE